MTRFPNIYALKREPDAETVLYATAQEAGRGKTQEDCFLQFSDECFVVADGISNAENSAVAARFACETAVWAYKHIRQHRYYWLDKKLFMKRIFRTTNMAIWQKQKEHEYTGGLMTTLSVLIVGTKTLWLGNAGDTQAWIVQEGSLEKLTQDKDVFESVPKKILGKKRLGLYPDYVSSPFGAGDVLCMATDGVADYLTVSDIRTAAAAAGNTKDTLVYAANALVQAAAANGSTADKTAVVIKRIIQ